MARPTKKSEKKDAVTSSRKSNREKKSRELFASPQAEVKPRHKKTERQKATTKKTPTKSPKQAKNSSSKKSTPKKAAGRRRGPKKGGKDEEEEYEIESIFDHRLYDKHYVEYAVRWIGYPKEVTWLTEFELQGAADLLADYKYSVTNKRDNPGDEYVVKEILAHRDYKKTRLYLVHWKGFDHPVSHTEQEEHELEGAKEILNEYKKKHGGNKKRASTSSNSSNKKSKKTNKRSRKEKSEEVTDEAETNEEENSENGDSDNQDATETTEEIQSDED